MAAPLIIRRFTLDDLSAVLAIQSASPESSAWSPADYTRAMLELDAFVALRDNAVGGFLIARHTAGETEVLNLAVAPAVRRSGVATALLAAALAAARNASSTRVFLEVRVSNAPALSFYLRHGFTRAGRRPRYYQNPPEDALVLVLSFS